MAAKPSSAGCAVQVNKRKIVRGSCFKQAVKAGEQIKKRYAMTALNQRLLHGVRTLSDTSRSVDHPPAIKEFSCRVHQHCASRALSIFFPLLVGHANTLALGSGAPITLKQVVVPLFRSVTQLSCRIRLSA